MSAILFGSIHAMKSGLFQQALVTTNSPANVETVRTAVVGAWRTT